MKPYYEHAGITIYHGDCREILPFISAELLMTDPPYGINHTSNHIADTTTAEWMNSAIDGDTDCSVRDYALSFFSEWVCFGSYKVAMPLGMRGIAVWDKGPASGMGDLTFPFKLSWELIFFAGSRWNGFRDEGVIKGRCVVTRASMGRNHPNEKPLDLMQFLLCKHPANTIVDPFMGTGPTLQAAKNLGRKAIGIEIEEGYCEIAATRLSQEVLAF
jgi:DNA modification methylase